MEHSKADLIEYPPINEMVRRLACCRFAPATAEKRFVNQCEVKRITKNGVILTERQVEYLKKIWHRYRRQLANQRYQ